MKFFVHQNIARPLSNILSAYDLQNQFGEYHGYIVNGVLSDDVDGRKFDEAGKLIK